jgi:hypothetical protein
MRKQSVDGPGKKHGSGGQEVRKRSRRASEEGSGCGRPRREDTENPIGTRKK